MKIIIFLTIAFSTFSLKAQFREIEGAMSKGKQKGICLTFDTINKTVAHDALIKAISDKDHNTSASIISFDELLFDNVKIPAISINTIDIYSKYFDSTKSIMLFVDLGSAFADSINFPKEAKAIQQLGIDIRTQVRAINKQNNIDSLKRKIKIIEDSLGKVNRNLETANNFIKNNTKGAAKDDKTVVETETNLLDAQAQIRAIDSLYAIKEKELNAFPLEHLKSINSSKNNALSKNRSTRKNLINSNVKSREKIAEYETEILLNKSSIDVLKDDPKASNKLTKSNQKLTTKINDEQLKITLNDASIKAINGVIKTDSIILKTNQDSLDAFDENGRRNAQKQLKNKKEKLVKKSQKNITNIAETKLESEQKKKEIAATIASTEEMKITQARLIKKQEDARLELSAITKP